MPLYLINKYEKELKDQKVDIGLAIYSEKDRKKIIAFITLLCLSMLFFIIFLLLGLKQPVTYSYLISGVVCATLGIGFLILLLITTYNANKKVSENIEENLHQRFAALGKAVNALYYKQAEENDTLDVVKTKELIQIYQDAIEGIKNKEKHRSAILIGFISAIGTCICTSLSDINNSGMAVNDWLAIAVSMLTIALFVATPVYFCNEINPIREKYKSMLAILRQYLVYVVEDNGGRIKR